MILLIHLLALVYMIMVSTAFILICKQILQNNLFNQVAIDRGGPNKWKEKRKGQSLLI